jgi:ribonuclease P protein component
MGKSIAFSDACARARTSVSSRMRERAAQRPERGALSPFEGLGVDPFDRSPIALPARSTTHSQGRTTRHEADIQAPQPQADQQARVPGSYEDEGRPRDAQPPSPQGTRTSHGVDRVQVKGVVAEQPDRSRLGEQKPSGARFPSASRIRRSSEIQDLRARGKRLKTAHLDVFLAASPVSRPRVGIVVAKHSHGSVERNKLKRRLRELARTRVLPPLWEAELPLDVLLRARREAYQASFIELGQEVDSVVEEACSRRPS